MTVESGASILVHIGTFLLWTAWVALATFLICRRYMGSSANAAEDYFAGGRALQWYVVAGSLMLTNLSTEQLVGLNGAVFKDGCLAGIWWEAGAAIAMMATASLFLPRYMALGLTTTTGFLGERYGPSLRTLVSAIFLLYYAVVLCPLVLYTGALAIRNIFDLEVVPLWVVSTLIGLLGAAYALFGGLKAVAVSDCLNGLGLVVVGAWVPLAAIQLLPNGLASLFEEPSLLRPLVSESLVYSDERMDRSRGIPSVPWHVTFTGMTLTNLYYWSTNQVIVQRVLAAESLAHGQKGVLFAASMKVVGFFFLCLPGILGLVMARDGVEVNGEVFRVERSDEVYPTLVRAVMPTWSFGLFAGVLLGSVLSTFNSALNSASTMFGLEIYKIYIDKEASDEKVVRVATRFGASLALLSFLIAPQLEHVDSIFSFLQHMNTVVSLPIVTVFFVGIATKLPDAFAAKVGFAVAVAASTASQFLHGLHFLHLFFVSFVLAALAMAAATYAPALRAVLGATQLELQVHPDSGNKGKAVVSMAKWRFLPHITTAILALLVLLVVALQLGNVRLFLAFWCCWGIVTLVLMAASVQGVGEVREQAEAVTTPKGVVDAEQVMPSAHPPNLLGCPVVHKEEIEVKASVQEQI